MKLNFNLSLWERFNAPTSKFFQPIMYVGSVIAVLAGFLSVYLGEIQADFQAAGIDIDLSVLMKYVAIVNAVISIVSKLTVDWEEYAKQNGGRLVFFPNKKTTTE